jgi:hypothetical protein
MSWSATPCLRAESWDLHLLIVIRKDARLIAQRRIDRAWIAEQAAGPDRGELTIARRFFANTTDAERDLIAYWQMVKLVEEAHLRYPGTGDA